MKLSMLCKMLIFVLLLFLQACRHGASTARIPAVRNFEVSRYMGKWYEVARLPNTFQHGMTHCVAEYTLQPDGSVTVLNSGNKNGKLKTISGTAVFSGDPEIGDLKVTFFSLFSSPYRIIFLEPDYSYAIVTGSTMDLLWILGRKKSIDQNRLQKYCGMLRIWGYAVNRLR